jgi:hypothetical protein
MLGYLKLSKIWSGMWSRISDPKSGFFALRISSKGQIALDPGFRIRNDADSKSVFLIRDNLFRNPGRAGVLEEIAR